MARDTWRLHGCERCGGDTFRETDDFGQPWWTCLLCGRSTSHGAQMKAPRPVATEEAARCA